MISMASYDVSITAHSAGIRKWISFLLVFCMVMGSLSGLTGTASAADDNTYVYGQPKVLDRRYYAGPYLEPYPLIKGVYYYPSAVPVKEGDKTVLKDLPAVFYYSDGYFAIENDPYNYSSHLATTSMNMAMAAFYSNKGATGKDADYSNKGYSILQFMKDIGCDQIYTNHFNKIRPQQDSIGVTIAQKKLRKLDKSETGRILVAIAVRGANYEKEWISNFTIGGASENEGEAKGFSYAAQLVTEEIGAYIQRTGLEQAVGEGKVDFWIAGYSRAGATSNLTARRLVDIYRQKGNRIFAYCIEAPQGGYETAKKAGSDYGCIHSVINKTDLVPRVAPSAMGFFRYGVDHYIPGSGANTGKTKSDNESYPVGSKDYEYEKKIMLKHLKVLNPSISFSDSFKVYGIDKKDLKSAMTDLGTAIFNPIPGSFLSYVVTQAVATLWGRNGWQKIIRSNSSVSMETFLDDFFTNLFSWTGTTRESYAVNPYCLEPAVQQLLAIVFDSTTEQVVAFKNSLFNKWNFVVNPYGSIISYGKDLVDLVSVFYKPFGEWHTMNDTKKNYYTDKFITWLQDKKAFDALGLTYEEKSMLYTGSLPKISDFAMTWLSQDYQHEKYDAGVMTQLFTFGANAENIMSNHYPEVNLAWLRAADNLYSYSSDDTEPIKVISRPKAVKASANGAGLSRASANGADLSLASEGSGGTGSNILQIDDPDVIFLENGSSIEDALPRTLPAQVAGGAAEEVPITWKLSEARYYVYDDISSDWCPMAEYDPACRQDIWVLVPGSYQQHAVTCDLYIDGYPELEPPQANWMELTYSHPIDVELSAEFSGTEIRYTLDGTDPRTSSTAQVYSAPIRIGASGKAEDVYILAYAVSADRSIYDDSDVMIWHFGYDGTVTPTNTPRPVPRTGDSGNPALWISLALLGLAGLAVSVLLKTPGKRK